MLNAKNKVITYLPGTSEHLLATKSSPQPTLPLPASPVTIHTHPPNTNPRPHPLPSQHPHSPHPHGPHLFFLWTGEELVNDQITEPEIVEVTNRPELVILSW